MSKFDRIFRACLTEAGTRLLGLLLPIGIVVAGYALFQAVTDANTTAYQELNSVLVADPDWTVELDPSPSHASVAVGAAVAAVPFPMGNLPAPFVSVALGGVPLEKTSRQDALSESGFAGDFRFSGPALTPEQMASFEVARNAIQTPANLTSFDFKHLSLGASSGVGGIGFSPTAEALKAVKREDDTLVAGGDLADLAGLLGSEAPSTNGIPSSVTAQISSSSQADLGGLTLGLDLLSLQGSQNPVANETPMLSGEPLELLPLNDPEAAPLAIMNPSTITLDLDPNAVVVRPVFKNSVVDGETIAENRAASADSADEGGELVPEHVPEPGAASLLALAGLFALRRRQRAHGLF